MDKAERKAKLETFKINIGILMDKIKVLIKEIEKVGTLSVNIGVTNSEKDQAYALGYQFFQQKKYEKAMVIFNALYLMDPLNKEVSRAVAATLQMAGAIPEAALHYLLTYFFHPEDLSLALQSGRCMVEAGSIAQAYCILLAIVELKRYPSDADNQQAQTDIKTLLNALEKQMDRMATEGTKMEAAKKVKALAGGSS
jgi:tetratricopeptide (TPR) repeat protein